MGSSCSPFFDILQNNDLLTYTAPASKYNLDVPVILHDTIASESSIS